MHVAGSSEKRIGLIAGWGRFPIVVAQALQRQGYDVYCLGVKDHADEALKASASGASQRSLHFFLASSEYERLRCEHHRHIFNRTSQLS